MIFLKINLTATFSYRVIEGNQDSKPVLTITSAEHVRLVAMVNELDQQFQSPLAKRKRRLAFALNHNYLIESSQFRS